MGSPIVLVSGKKGPGDTLVLFTKNGEVLKISELLLSLKYWFESEASYYPKEKGFYGAEYLLMAVHDVYDGVPVPEVCAKYQLDYDLVVVDQRRKSAAKVSVKVKPVTDLAELLL